MAWRYRGPKGFVSKAKYERYKHLDSYSRISDSKWKGSRQPTKTGRTQEPSSGNAAPAPSAIKTLKDYKKYYDWYDQYDFPEMEIETGVDY